MEKLEVSVIIPVYNAERCIADCINSILEQTHQSWELILVDDGSKDDSLEICNRYARMDSRIKVIHKENGGVSSARNTGLKNANGEFVIFIDADDRIKKDMLKKLIDKASERQVNMVLTGYEVTGSNAYYNDIETLEMLDQKQEISKQELLSVFINVSDKERLTGYVWRILFRRDELVRHGLRFHEEIKMSEDFLFILQSVLALDSYAVVPEEMYIYNINTGSSTAKYMPSVPEDMFNINEWMRTDIVQNNMELYTNYMCCCANTYLVCVQNICRSNSPYIRLQKVKAAREIKKKYGYMGHIKQTWLMKENYRKKGWIATIMFRWYFDWAYILMYSMKEKRK